MGLDVLFVVLLLSLAAAADETSSASKCPAISPTLHTLDLSQAGGVFYSVERKPGPFDDAICTRSSGVGSAGRLTSDYLAYDRKRHIVLNGTIVAVQPDPVNRPTLIKEDVTSVVTPGVTYTFYFTMIASGELDNGPNDKIKWSAAYNCTEPTGSATSAEAVEHVYVAASVPTLTDDQIAIVNEELTAIGIDTSILEIVPQPDRCPDF